MQKNGKIINCKVCNKEIYIPKSRFGFKKYCSRICASKDNYGFKPRKKKCVICDKRFIIHSQLKIQKTTCSSKCHYALTRQISQRYYDRRKNIKIKRVCTQCKKSFFGQDLYITKICSKKCFSDFFKQRTKKANPNFRCGAYNRKDGILRLVMIGLVSNSRNGLSTNMVIAFVRFARAMITWGG